MTVALETHPGPLDRDRCYRAIESRDSRFDGWFIVGVRTTGIYCRPSCPTPIRPKPTNVDYFHTAAAAQRAGFRACKRCRPDASPGSPEWNRRGDLVGRAMRSIADGTVDRVGVAGLASELAVGERHLHRILTAELGAGPLAIARAHRAQTARTLIETTELHITDIAFASGFSSIRQFNDTIREVFATSPRELRARRSTSKTGLGSEDTSTHQPGDLVLRLPVRAPVAVDTLLQWFRMHEVAGLQRTDGLSITRTLRLQNGAGIVTLTPHSDHVSCSLRLEHTADLAAAVSRCRRLLDLDADPVMISEVLGADPALESIVGAVPGLRMPGAVDGFEAAVFVILAQQVSVAAAVTFTSRLVAQYGERLDRLNEPDLMLFPTAEQLAEASLDDVGITGRRKQTVRAVAAACARHLSLGPGADRDQVRAALLDLPGIGPWSADCIVMRALGHPDVLLATDLIVRRGAEQLGLPGDAAGLATHAERWAPWRSYANHYLWESALRCRTTT